MKREDTKRHRGHPVQMEARGWNEVASSQEMLGAMRAGGSKEGLCPGAFKKDHSPADTCQTLSLQNTESMFVLFQATQFVVIH
jgi:hypothetical protein